MSLKPVFVIVSLWFLSNRNIVEVAQFLSSDGGQKTEESDFNIKLIEDNKLIGRLLIVIHSDCY